MLLLQPQMNRAKELLLVGPPSPDENSPSALRQQLHLKLPYYSLKALFSRARIVNSLLY